VWFFKMTKAGKVPKGHRVCILSLPYPKRLAANRSGGLVQRQRTASIYEAPTFPLGGTKDLGQSSFRILPPTNRPPALKPSAQLRTGRWISTMANPHPLAALLLGTDDGTSMEPTWKGGKKQK